MIKSIYVPDSVTTIENAAFNGVTAKSIRLSESLVNVEDAAFENCDYLESITFPASAVNVKEDSVERCNSLQSINFDEDNPVYKSIDGVWYSKDGKTLISCPAGKTGDLTIGAEVDKISEMADRGFKHRTKLNNINVDVGNPNYSSVDGMLCSKDGTTLLMCPGGKNEVVIPAVVSSINEDAFNYAYNIEELLVDDGNQTYTSEDGVLLSKDKTSLVRCPIRKYGNYVIPKSVTYINAGAFNYCGRLRSVELHEGITNTANIYGLNLNVILYVPTGMAVDSKLSGYDQYDQNDKESLYKYSVNGTSATICKYVGKEENVVIPDTLGGNTVIGIGTYAFGASYGVKSITIPEGVTGLWGYYSFDDCDGLESINIPTTMRYFYSLFEYTKNLKNVVVAEGNSEYKTIDNVLYNGDASSIVGIPLGFTGVFNVIASVRSINTAYMNSSHITGYTVDKDNATYAGEDGVLFTKDMKKLVRFPADRAGNYVIPLSVEYIEGYAFKRCTKLTGVDMQDGITDTGIQIFYGCTALKDVKIAPSLSVIREGMFELCTSLETLVIPEGVKQVEQVIVGECDSTIKNIVLPESLSFDNFNQYPYAGSYPFCYECKDITFGVRDGSKAYDYVNECHYKYELVKSEGAIGNDKYSYTAQLAIGKFTLENVTKKGDETIKYEVISGDDVIGVDAEGVCSLKKAGNAVLHLSMDATDNNLKAFDRYIRVNVVEEGQQAITTNENTFTAYLYDKTFDDSIFGVKADGEISYKSDNEDVVSYKDGKFQTNKLGTARITITSAKPYYVDVTKVVTVNVKMKEQGPIALVDIYVTGVGDKIQLTPLAEGKLTYESLKPESVSIDNNGNLRVLKYSETAKIKATSKKEGYADQTVTVKVIMGKKAQNGISMYSLNFNKNVGDKPFSLGIHADGKVTYWGYNSKVVKVSKGVVTIVGKGTTKIYMTSVKLGYYDRVSSLTVTVNAAVAPKAVSTGVKASGGGKLAVSWKTLSGVSGYQVQYSTVSNFASSKTKTVTVSGRTKKAYTIKNLKKKRTYYVRVRAYKKLTKGQTNGKWSSAKHLKVK